MVEIATHNTANTINNEKPSRCTTPGGLLSFGYNQRSVTSAAKAPKAGGSQRNRKREKVQVTITPTTDSAVIMRMASMMLRGSETLRPTRSEGIPNSVDQ